MPTVTYRFTSIGADEVARHFDTISARAQQQQAVMRGLARQQQQTSTIVGRAANTEARQKERNLQYVARIRDRHFLDEQRKTERHQKELQRINDKESREYLRQEEAKLKKAEQQQERYARRMDKFRNERLGAITEKLATASMAGIGGVAALTAKAAQDRMALSDAANRLSINARLPGQSAIDPRVLAREAESAAIANPGTKAEDVIAGQSRFVAMTGDMDTARGLGSVMASAAMASDSNLTDIAATMATVRNKFGVKDPEQMKQAMAMLIGQGRSGAFEMSDASQYFEEMGAAGARFGLGTGVKGISTLGGLAQIAKTGSGSGAEASTAVRAMFSDLVQNSTKIKQLTGADVFKKGTHKTQTNDIQDVLVNTIAGAKGNQVTLEKVFGERGIKAVSELVTAYNQAQGALGKGASETEKRSAGEKAMREILDQSINVQATWSDVVQDSAQASKSFTAIGNAAWESVAQELGTSVLPVLERLSTHGHMFEVALEGLGDTVGDTMDSFDELISWMEKTIPGFKKNGSEQQTAAAAQAKIDAYDAIELRGGKLTSKQERERHRAENDLAEMAQKGIYPQFADTRPGAGGVLLPLKPGQRPPMAGPYSDAYYADHLQSPMGASGSAATGARTPFNPVFGVFGGGPMVAGALGPLGALADYATHGKLTNFGLSTTVPSALGAPVGVASAIASRGSHKLSVDGLASLEAAIQANTAAVSASSANTKRGDPTGSAGVGQ